MEPDDRSVQEHNSKNLKGLKGMCMPGDTPLRLTGMAQAISANQWTPCSNTVTAQVIMLLTSVPPTASRACLDRIIYSFLQFTVLM